MRKSKNSRFAKAMTSARLKKAAKLERIIRQVELAQALEVAPSYAHELEFGRKIPSIEMLGKILAFYPESKAAILRSLDLHVEKRLRPLNVGSGSHAAVGTDSSRAGNKPVSTASNQTKDKR